LSSRAAHLAQPPAISQENERKLPLPQAMTPPSCSAQTEAPPRCMSCSGASWGESQGLDVLAPPICHPTHLVARPHDRGMLAGLLYRPSPSALQPATWPEVGLPVCPFL
jgi:hypothetical protein